jgi:hypothetical protein
MEIFESAPGGGAATAWAVGVRNGTTTTIAAYAWVICAYVSS